MVVVVVVAMVETPPRFTLSAIPPVKITREGEGAYSNKAVTQREY